MSRLSKGARWYVVSVSAAALCFLIYFSVFPSTRNLTPLTFIFFLLFTIMTELYPIQLPGENSFTTAGIFYYAILLLFGTTPALWIITISGTFSEIWQRRAWYRVLFNESQVILAFALAGLAYQWLSGGVIALHTVRGASALVLSSLIIFACNATLLAGVVSLTQNMNFSKVWKGQWEGIVSHLLVTFPVGILVAFIYLQEPLAVLILVVPFFIMHYAFRARTTNVELDKKLQELSLLFEASHYLGTSLSLRRALQVLLDITQRIIHSDRTNIFLFEPKPDKNYLALKATSSVEIDPQALVWEYNDSTRAYFPGDAVNGVLIHGGIESLRLSFPFWTADQRKLVKELYDGSQSGLVVPLRQGEHLLGFVEATSRMAGIYTPEDLKLLSTLANVAAVAIKNASLYEDTLDLATKDGLTSLYNHRLMQEFLEKELARASRENFEVSLIMFDIDHFKHFNDTYGHMTGDLVLKEVARMAQKCVREGDVLARYGGEEFAVILPRTSRESALEIAERLRQSVEQGVSPVFSQKMEITISLGIATFPSDAMDKVGFVKAADSALYHAKAMGRNRSVPFSNEIRSTEEERAIIGIERIQSFLMLQIARMLANYLDVRSGVRRGHTDKIAAWATKLGEKMGMQPEEIKTLRTAALLHDVGKVVVGQKLLRKAGPLTEAEREQIKLHPEVGATLLAQFPVFHRVAAIIYQQQECFDGTGYPLGLEGEDILLSARILSVVTAYFAMRNKQPFRRERTREEALDELGKATGKQFDPGVVSAFAAILAEEPAA